MRCRCRCKTRSHNGRMGGRPAKVIDEATGSLEATMRTHSRRRLSATLRLCNSATTGTTAATPRASPRDAGRLAGIQARRDQGLPSPCPEASETKPTAQVSTVVPGCNWPTGQHWRHVARTIGLRERSGASSPSSPSSHDEAACSREWIAAQLLV